VSQRLIVKGGIHGVTQWLQLKLKYPLYEGKLPNYETILAVCTQYRLCRNLVVMVQINHKCFLAQVASYMNSIVRRTTEMKAKYVN
jgi:hypothetical protein